jgi:hypothetical protein
VVKSTAEQLVFGLLVAPVIFIFNRRWLITFWDFLFGFTLIVDFLEGFLLHVAGLFDSFSFDMSLLLGVLLNHGLLMSLFFALNLSMVLLCMLMFVLTNLLSGCLFFLIVEHSLIDGSVRCESGLLSLGASVGSSFVCVGPGCIVSPRLVLREGLRILVISLKLVIGWVPLKILLFILTKILTESRHMDISLILGVSIDHGVVVWIGWVQGLELLLVLISGVRLDKRFISILILVKRMYSRYVVRSSN